MNSIEKINKSVQYKHRETAKNLPLILMGLVGFSGILISLAINEQQINLQTQCAELISSNQVFDLMLQVVLF